MLRLHPPLWEPVFEKRRGTRSITHKSEPLGWLISSLRPGQVSFRFVGNA